MLFTEAECKNGYADYCKAKNFIESMNEALKKDKISFGDLPENVRKQYESYMHEVDNYEKE